LIELDQLRKDVVAYQTFIERDAANDRREMQLHQQELAIKEKELELKEQKLTMAVERAEMYKALYEAVTKKGCGISGFFKKLFTLWRYKC